MFLDTAQKQAVSGIAETGRGVAQRRAQVILLYDEGLTTIEVARQVGMSRRQVRYWKQQFHEHGLAIFSRWNGEAAEAVEETGVLPEAPAQAAPNPAEEVSDLPLPVALDHPGVTPDDSLAEAGRKVMLFQFNEMLSHEAGTRLGADIEELHDMRVATRRMRAAFDVFGEAFHAKVVKTHLKGLRATGRALGRVRDLDVFIEKAGAYRLTLAPEAQPGLDLLLEMWGRERDLARATMLEHFDSPAYAHFKRDFSAFLLAPDAGVRELPAWPPAPSHVQDIVPVLVYTRLAAVRAFDGILSSASILQLHALRIEFKRLRYTLEYFAEILGKESKLVVSEIKGMQDHLGDLHDAQVACQILSEFLDHWEDGQANLLLQERQSPGPVLDYLTYRHAERHHLLVTFPQVWAHFNRPELRQVLAQSMP